MVRNHEERNSLLVCAGLVWLLLGCQGPVRSEASGSAVSGSPATPGAVGPTHPVGSPGCQDDRDCPGYLRCLEAQCQEPPAVTGRGPAQGPRVVFELGPGQQAAFHVELALSPWEQQRGLMFRPRLAPAWGMIFLHRQDQVHSFWMRNTLVPLDMLFLSGQGTVVCVVEAEPLTDDSRTCGQPSRHILELERGTARRLGIRSGTRFRLVDFPSGVPLLDAEATGR